MPRETSHGCKPKQKNPWRRETPRVRPTLLAGPPCWLFNSVSNKCRKRINRPTGSWSICFEPRNRCIVLWHCFNRAESEPLSRPESARYSPWASNMPLGHWRTIPLQRQRERLLDQPLRQTNHGMAGDRSGIATGMGLHTVGVTDILNSHGHKSIGCSQGCTREGF